MTVSENATQTKSGLTITVEPLASAEYPSKAPELTATQSVNLCSTDSAVPAALRASNPNVAVAKVPQVDLAFLVTIKNDTSHSLNLHSAVIQIEDSRETTYEPSQVTTCGSGTTEVKNEERNPQELTSIRVLPGKHRYASVPFCLKNKLPQFPIRLLVYDVPVQTDAAGTVTRRENFTFKIDGASSAQFYQHGPNGTAVASLSPPECVDIHDSTWATARQLKEAAAGLRTGAGSDMPSLHRQILKSSQDGIILSCWRTYGKDDTDVVATMVVDPAGSVTSVDVATLNGTLANCIGRALKMLRSSPLTVNAPVTAKVQLRVGGATPLAADEPPPSLRDPGGP